MRVLGSLATSREQCQMARAPIHQETSNLKTKATGTAGNHIRCVLTYSWWLTLLDNLDFAHVCRQHQLTHVSCLRHVPKGILGMTERKWCDRKRRKLSTRDSKHQIVEHRPYL